MTRNCKFRLYPTKAQDKELHALVNQHCDLYNTALEQRGIAWKLFRQSASYTTQANELKELRQEFPELAAYGYSGMQQTLRKLDKSFQRFFQGAGGYPRFKAKSRFKSVTFPVGDGAVFKENIKDWKKDKKSKAKRGSKVAPKAWATLKVKGIGAIKVKQHRLLEGAAKQITVKRYASGHWYVTLACIGVPVHPLPKTGQDVGIDMGCVTLVATSDAKLFKNPRWLRKLEDKQKYHQQAQARAEKGSNHWRQAGKLRAKIEEKIVRQRRDNHFKIARYLVRNYDRIARESLSIKNMTASASGTVAEPGTNVAQKSGLNRSILDAAWGQFQDILFSVAEDAEKLVWSGPAAYSSQECSKCHYVSAVNRISQSVFTCGNCNHTAHADVNGAEIMLYRAGLAQWGEKSEKNSGIFEPRSCRSLGDGNFT